METTEQKNQLATIIETSGLEKAKGSILIEKFNDYFQIASEWESKANALIVNDASQLTEMKQAREGRLFLVKKRTAIEATRKALKEDSLCEGKAIDAIATMLKNLIEPIEKNLEEKEKFAERVEAERKAKLHLERVELVKPYKVDWEFLGNLGEMDNQMFEALHTGLKKNHEDKIEADKKAEEDRIAKEKADAEAIEAQRIENERLKNEQKEKDAIRVKRNEELKPYIIFIRDYNGMLNMDESEYQKEFLNIQIAAKNHYEYESKENAKKEALAKEQFEKDEVERKKQEAAKNKAALELKKANEDKAKLEAELKAKADEEARIKAAKEAEDKAKLDAEKKAAKAPKKQKLNIWIDGFVMGTPIGMNEDETVIEILQKFESFKVWAKSKIETL